ncbi:MAG: PadR family transcriptional regulator [Thaumarchaeota archaeon]|nr:PadR family transcriptional regulator [Nitrososphaerota archaeon]
MTRSLIPRGFSRFYVLGVLKERSMTGKQIIDEATSITGGSWKPSPGLVYPLLGKLLAGGLIEEVDGGYRITPRGANVLEDYEKSKKEFDNLFGVFLRLGLFGRTMAGNLADRLIDLLGSLRLDMSRFTAEQQGKYRAFLESELRRLEQDKKGRVEDDAAPA